jgi:acetyltransferase-like isoleucine patch superfamily enzyme
VVFARTVGDNAAVAPLVSDVGALVFGGHTLRSLQDEAVAAVGHYVVDVTPGQPIPPHAVHTFSDAAFFTANTARIWASGGTPLRAAIRTVRIGTRVVELPAGPAPTAVIGNWMDALDVGVWWATTTHLVRHAPKVHPTSLLRNVRCGKDVRIGAHATVMNAVLGDDVHIADHSVIVDACIGSGSRTLVDAHLRRVVAGRDTTLSNVLLEDCIVGDGAFVTTAVSFFCDPHADHTDIDGIGRVRRMAGGAIGASARLGARALFRAGVAVPAGALLVTRAGEALSSLGADAQSAAGVVVEPRALLR